MPLVARFRAFAGRGERSLRQRLVLWLSLPVVVFILIDAWASYRAALTTAQLAFDRLLVTSAHALADLSPWSAKAFGEAMAPVLDRHMVDDGWYPKTQRIRAWTWDGIPARELIDF